MVERDGESDILETVVGVPSPSGSDAPGGRETTDKRIGAADQTAKEAGTPARSTEAPADAVVHHYLVRDISPFSVPKTPVWT